MNQNAAKAHLQCLVFISSSDGELSKEEHDFFVERGKELGLDETAIGELTEEISSGERFIENILDDVIQYKAEEGLLSDLIELCLVDGEYSLEEQIGVRNIASYLGIGLDQVLELENQFLHKGEEDDSLKGILKIGKKLASATGKAIKKGAKLVASKVKTGSKEAAKSVASGIGLVGSKISIAVASAKKLREENKQLREELAKVTLTEATKQKVIMQLNEKIALLNDQLKLEMARNNRNEEMIDLLQAQIDELMETVEIAENTQIA